MRTSDEAPDPPETIAAEVGGAAHQSTVLMELCRLWLAARDTGNPVSVHDLCRDRPELSVHLQRAIDVLGAADPNATTAHHPAEPADASPNMPRQIGRFQVRSFLGGGAFGWVYRAFDPTLRREVAVKLPRPERIGTPADRDRFLNEARAAATLRHPNVVPVHEIGEDTAGTPFIVMAFVPGPTLAGVLAARAGTLPPHEACAVVRTLALAVHTAHEKGVVHRDLKPGNVLFDTERGEYAVTDFGLARVQLPDDPQTSSTGVVGTPGYMPPEQARGESALVGPRSDVYSLGVILFELLTGRLPFTGGSAADVISKVLTAAAPSASALCPGVPRELDAVCRRAMAKKPADRYPSAKALAAALEPFAGPAVLPAVTPVAAPEPLDFDTAETVGHADRRTRSRRTADKNGNRRALVAGAAVAVAVVAALAVNLARPPRESGAAKSAEPPVGPTPKPVVDSPPKVGFDQAAERRAAEWVLGVGGKLTVVDQKTGGVLEPAKRAELPAGFRVASIDIRRVEVANDETVLANLAGLSGLTHIDLTTCSQLTDTGFGVLARYPSLVRIRIRHAPRVGDAGMKLLERHPTLRQVYLSDTGMTPAGLASVVTIPRLAELGVHGHPITDEWLAVAARCRSLEQLYVGFCQEKNGSGITAAGFRHLAGLKHLYLLDLDGAALEPGALKGLPELPVLKELFLRRTGADDDDLAAVAKYRTLRSLGLHETKVTDAGMATVATCPQLENLFLEGTAVGDAGLKALTACGELKEVFVADTAVTAAGVREFRRARPNCKVTPAPKE